MQSRNSAAPVLCYTRNTRGQVRNVVRTSVDDCLKLARLDRNVGVVVPDPIIDIRQSSGDLALGYAPAYAFILPIQDVQDLYDDAKQFRISVVPQQPDGLRQRIQQVYYPHDNTTNMILCLPDDACTEVGPIRLFSKNRVDPQSKTPVSFDVLPQNLSVTTSLTSNPLRATLSIKDEVDRQTRQGKEHRVNCAVRDWSCGTSPHPQPQRPPNAIPAIDGQPIIPIHIGTVKPQEKRELGQCCNTGADCKSNGCCPNWKRCMDTSGRFGQNIQITCNCPSARQRLNNVGTCEPSSTQ